MKRMILSRMIRFISLLVLGGTAAAGLVACIATSGCSFEKRATEWPEPISSPLTELEVRELLSVRLADRGDLILNGQWQFGATWTDGLASQALAPVPGSWKRAKQLPSIEAAFSQNLSRGFYRRSVQLPPEWTNGGLQLSFTRISTDARVYIDGKPAGSVSFPGGKLDISKFVANKRSFDLVVEVAAARDETEALQLLDVLDNATPAYSRQDDKMIVKGIIGDVILQSRPRGNHIKDVHVRTSVRRGLLVVETTLTSEIAHSPVRAVAVVSDRRSGKIVKQFSGIISPDPDRLNRVVACWAWNDAELWAPGNPQLYRLDLHLSSASLTDSYQIEFGFREFWISGKQFFLNNKPIKLRPCFANIEYSTMSADAASVDGIIDGLLASGFNCQEMWPYNSDKRGQVHLYPWWYQRADLKGLLVIAAAPDAGPFNQDWNTKRHEYEQLADSSIVPLRNHPSIIMWTTSPNVFLNEAMNSPDWLGIEGPQNKVKPVYVDVAKFIKDRSPDTPVFSHNGGVCGDVYSENNYLCMTPLQEREEWLQTWAEKSPVPYIAVEYGSPFICTMLRGRARFSEAISTEPFMTEYAAIYLGEEAYKIETDEYRSQIAANLKANGKYRSWQYNRALYYAPAHQKLQALFSKNTWRSWRATGITGGMIPWDSGYGWEPPLKPVYTEIDDSGEGRIGPFRKRVENAWLYYLQEKGGWKLQPAGRAIMENNGPYLSYLAGAGSGIRLLAKDHHYLGGQLLEKQIVLINDSDKESNYSAEWSIEIGGRTAESGAFSGKIGRTGKLLIPISCRLPPVASKTDGQLKLKTTFAGTVLPLDQLNIRVYPPAQPQSLHIDDPVGETTQWLTSLNWKCLSAAGAQAANSRIIAIGRNCLSSGRVSLEAYKKFVEQGGIVLLFSQKPEWWTKQGLRVCPHVTRRVFPVRSEAFSAAFDSEDLRDWNGSGSLLATNTINGNLPIPAYGWHRSNQGSVTSAAIEKPHHGNWRPLLECEFDLAYSPLLVHQYGSGYVIVCCLDLEGRDVSEPVAHSCVQKIVEYAGSLPVRRSQVATLLGSQPDRDFYSSVGIDISSTPDQDGLVILAPGASPEQIGQAKQMLLRGRTIFAQGAPGEQLAGETVSTVDTVLPPYIQPAPVDICRGLGAGDLHVRVPRTVKVLSGQGTFNSGLLGHYSYGSGNAYICCIQPADLPIATQPYLRLTSWRQRRCISQLLSNLNVRFVPEVSLFSATNKSTTAGFYSKDYIAPDSDNFAVADDPYRYFHW